MKNLLTLSLLLSISNTTFSNECTQLHTHDTHNVGHQFYDALIETPKDAIVKGAVATKDLTKTVAAAVVYSSAAHELKDAAKELVVDTPVKTATAIKNGTIKAYDATKEGAKIVYNNAIVKPAHVIKHVAHDVAESDFVQGTKETAVEVGQQFKEVGQDAWSATKYGVKRVYHVLVEKPVGAVKAAGHYLAHGDEHLATPVATAQVAIAHLPQEKFVVICETPVTIETEVACTEHHVQTQTHVPFTTVSVMSPCVAENVIQGVYIDTGDTIDPQLNLEYVVNVEPRANSTKALSENTLKLLSQAYDSVAFDLCHQK